MARVLQNLVEVMCQKDGKTEEEVLADLATPQGMEMFVKMMKIGASGAAGSLEKTQTLARGCGRAIMYVDYILKYCPWLQPEDKQSPKGPADSKHGCMFKDCKGEDQHLYFGLDLASANGFYPSRFTMFMPKVRWYASEHMADPADYLGTKMMEDCIEYMTTAPKEAEEPKLKRPKTEAKGSSDLLEMEGDPPEDEEDKTSEDEMEAWLCSLDTEDSRQSAKLLRGRTSCVDVTEEMWPSVEHLQGFCSVVLCTSLLTQVGYREPLIWTDVLQGAAQLLEEGGILLMYDTEKWGDFANVEKMTQQIKKAQLDLELLERQEPVDFSDDPDGRMFTVAFRKTGSSARKSCEWLVEKAEQLKQAGNSYYSNLAKCRDAREKLSSSPRVAALWKSVACYVQGLDCLSLARSQSVEERSSQMNHISSRLYSNLAAAYLELGETADTYEHALRVIDLALVCDPDWDRAKERKEKIQKALSMRPHDAGA
ncbi:Uncharacterized protein SCF082_LOCUS21917 [Durusdinium trenchii]